MEIFLNSEFNDVALVNNDFYFLIIIVYLLVGWLAGLLHYWLAWLSGWLLGWLTGMLVAG